MKSKILSAAVISYFTLCSLAYGYVASSDNYQIQADSINFGGLMSTSSAYKVEDTLGEWAIGQSATTNILRAGYQALFFDSYLSISNATAVTLTPAINGAGGGVPAGGAVSWQVTTNNPAGYALYVKAAGTPALTSGGNSFADYAPSYADPDLDWSVPDNAARFGFSPTGSDIAAKYKNNGVSCNAGGLITNGKCWNGFSAVNELVASAELPNYPAGTITTLNLQAEVGKKAVVPAGNYSATIIATVVAL